VRSHENLSLGKQYSYLYHNLSTVVAGIHLHGEDPSAQKGTHKQSQGKIENYQENKVLGHPCLFEKYRWKSYLLVALGQK
jgi:hypothetical protein